MKILFKIIFNILIIIGINFSAYAFSTDWKISSDGVNDIIKMRISSATEGVVGLYNIPISLEIVTSTGWKIYWRNPGDSGLPTEITFDGSQNLKNFNILWPAPFRFSTFGIDTFGYEGKIILPINLIPERVNEEINLISQISLLACNEICIPFKQDFVLNIPNKPHAPNLNTRERAKYLSLVPKLIIPKGFSIGAVALNEDGILLERIKFPINNYDVFVENEKGINFGKPIKSGNNILLPKLNENIKILDEELIKLTFVSESVSFEKKIKLIQTRQNINSYFSFFEEITIFILISFVGGFLLNFMPCVLPIISLKLGSIITENLTQQNNIRMSFVFTSLGITSSFLILAIALISLKHFGHSISWGMQFQNSSFLLLITLVILLFGFNMLGLFEIRLPRILLDLMPKNHQGFIGDFLRGFLTTIMSTPCSAPFVGTAITFAFSESYSIMLIIFFTMSIGLSSPWILVAVYPKFINYLPSSGKWMLKLKYVLGVLLLLTSVWTLSMFSKSVSINNSSENYYSENGPTLLWEKGLAQKLASEGNIVLIDITADWCITCKLNKFIIYNNKKINEKIQNGDLKIIQGDWTLPNEDILNFLAENKRYGIPYNSVHGPNNIEGIILPEILTVKTLLNTIKQVKE